MVLTANGFAVEDISQAPPAKRADLRLWFGNEEYVLEAKLREPHSGWHDLMQQVAREGYGTMSREIEPWNSLSSNLLEAHEQLEATPSGSEAFRVLWLVALHDDDKFVVSCIEKRLVGEVTLLPIDRQTLKIGDPKPCYHHAHSDFQRCRGMDAAVLGTRKGANLFVNYFSSKRGAFRHSQLHRMFAEHNAVVDPELECLRGTAFMLGDDFTGTRDGTNQWSYVKDRFGVATTVMREYQFSGMASVPVSAFQKTGRDQEP
jgi:hypothetical protein